jgi:hypothetical protein
MALGASVRGLLDASKFFMGVGKRGLVDEVAERGLVFKQFTGEQIRQAKEGAQTYLIEEATKNLKGGRKLSAKALGYVNVAADIYSEKMLLMFSASEQIARAVTFDMAKQTTSLLMKNKGARAKFIDGISDPGTKNRAVDALLSGNESDVLDVVSSYLNRETMFNYDRMNLAEAARTLGPMFSMFTKWPLKIGGDIVTEFQIRDKKSEAAKIVFERLMAPYLLLVGAQSLLENSDLTESQETFRKTIIKDVSKKAALSSVADAFPEEGFSNPALQTASAVLGGMEAVAESIRQQDLAPLGKMAKTINDYVGVGGLYKVANDFHLLMTNEPLKEDDK